MDRFQEQLQIEQQAHADGVSRALKELSEAIKQGRVADLPVGKQVVARAFSVASDAVAEKLMPGKAGMDRKYTKHLRNLGADLCAVIALRVVLQHTLNTEYQSSAAEVLSKLGLALETETLIKAMKEEKPWYVDRIREQIKKQCTSNTRHISNKFRTGAKDLGITDYIWEPLERVGTARLLLSCIYPLGLFEWDKKKLKNGKSVQVIVPSEELIKHVEHYSNHLKALVRYPVMVSPPLDWKDMYTGGYYSTEMNVLAPMMKLRPMPKEYRNWIVQHLREGLAEEVKEGLNKIQSVPYKVNTKVLDIAQQAILNPNGILGLPAHGGRPKPEFPFGEDFDKHNCTEEQQVVFAEWKRKAAEWYTVENTRVGRKMGVLAKLRELQKLRYRERWWCPVFLDWRGRVYFRSTLNPQSADVVKGCIDFANGKPLGKEGLFWLKVQVANCCGYDKTSFEDRVKWVEDHWDDIQNFLDHPLEVEPPDPDTAFTLLQAGYALQEALSLYDPTGYVCTVPVALDATCSGLQHYSAMLRDEVGGFYTNLVASNKDVKHDIYKAVADKAIELLPTMTDDPCIIDYWKRQGVSRSLAKRPTMTHVYSATLESCKMYVTSAAVEENLPLIDGYSYMRLCFPLAKALKKAVEVTVPKATEAMRYLKTLVLHSNKPLRWITPVGVPVINWTSKEETKQIKVSSLGLKTVFVGTFSKTYDRRKACTGISPNFIHSCDSTHLIKVVNAFDGQILPIHDSFATLPSDVGILHGTLVRTMSGLYENQQMLDILKVYNEFEELDDVVPPAQGSLDLEELKESTFAFC